MKVTPVKGTNDYLPKEVEIRDYLQQKILEVYLANGFEHIITPVIEDIENLDKSDGGENLNLLEMNAFKEEISWIRHWHQA